MTRDPQAPRRAWRRLCFLFGAALTANLVACEPSAPPGPLGGGQGGGTVSPATGGGSAPTGRGGGSPSAGGGGAPSASGGGAGAETVGGGGGGGRGGGGGQAVDSGSPSRDGGSAEPDAGPSPGKADGGAGAEGPCDVYAAGNTPCVAAHSTVRALYRTYAGKLYQVRRASDKTTRDISVSGPGGFADAASQESFCTGTSCTISVIYDQSPNGNDLTKAPAGGWLNNGGLEADAAAARIKVGGHTVYGIYTTMSWNNDTGSVGYRNNKTKNIATGDAPEGIYMVASGKHFNQYCCFDYGNAETNNKDNGPGTMETLYFGSSTQWGRGSGSGPWVMADLEDGVFGGNSFSAPASNTSLSVEFVTAVLRGDSGNHFILKGGDAQSGELKTMWDGTRPNGYHPMKKEGAIILGIGGDNSHTGEGTFFEGAITSGSPTDATEKALQENIVRAGYGH